ncbi:MAG: LytR C-terminal domain-containing protein [Candidatus Peribacteria bacterium]|jgi:hypothetical protein|nr:LytR C-terminal domain-containing protein [Candidatus Peribacteria bacterium]
MNATAEKVQQYKQMQDFTQFLISNVQFVKEKASIEILNGIDKAVARSKGMSATPFAGQIAVKLKRYGFNITNTQNSETPSSGSYLLIHGLEPLDATISAIQTFLPFTDIRYDTGSILTGLDENGKEYSYFEGTDITIMLGADYLLGSESLSGLVQKKFSYDL